MAEQQDKDVAHFDCTVEQRDQAVVVSVTGPVDLSTQAGFADGVRNALRQAASSVVIDLAGVTFLASPGLAVLVQAQEEAMRTDKQLYVAVGGEVARRSIEVTGLTQILSLVPDVRTALAAGTRPGTVA